MGVEEASRALSSAGLWVVKMLCGSNGKARVVTPPAVTVGPTDDEVWTMSCAL